MRKHTSLIILITLSAIIILFGISTQSVYEDEVRDLPIYLWHIPKNPVQALFFYDYSYADRANSPLSIILFGTVFEIVNEITQNKVLALRFFSALSGLITILLVYKLAKEMFNKKTGMLAALLFLTMPFNLFLSRFALYYMPAIPPIILSYYFLIKNKPLISSLFITLSFLIRYDTIISLIPLIIYSLITNKKQTIKLILLPVIIISAYITIQWDAIQVTLFKEALSTTLKKISVIESVTHFLKSHILTAPLIIIGLLSVKKKQTKLIILNFMIYFTYFVLYMRWWGHYYFFAYAFMGWGGAIISAKAINKIKNKKTIPIILLFILINMLNVYGITNTPLEYAKNFQAYPNWNSVINIISEYKNKSIIAQQPTVLWFYLTQNFKNTRQEYFVNVSDNEFVDFGFKTDKIIIHHAIITKNENLNKIDESIILKPTRTQEYWIWTMDYNPELDKLNYLQIQEYPIKEFMITIKQLNTSQEIR